MYGRIGWQREDDAQWSAFGTVQLRAWRDLADRWALEAGYGWSNSNLASSSSFRRTALALAITRGF